LIGGVFLFSALGTFTAECAASVAADEGSFSCLGFGEEHLGQIGMDVRQPFFTQRETVRA
jgi:hypothetical protein